MEKLIDDSETFQKDRPLTITNEQRAVLLKELAESILKWGHSKDSIANIVADLDDVCGACDSGYEMAKELEDRYSDYTINSNFIELLESWDSLVNDRQRENVRDWVSAHDIKPKFSAFQKLTLKKAPFFSFVVGDEVYINYLKTDTAEYVIDKDPKRKGGTVVSYEKLELCI